MSMHDHVFDRCEDIHRSGPLVPRLETEDLAGGLVQIEAALALGRSWDDLLEIWELVEETADGAVHRGQYSYQLMHVTCSSKPSTRCTTSRPSSPQHQ